MAMGKNCAASALSNVVCKSELTAGGAHLVDEAGQIHCMRPGRVWRERQRKKTC